MTTSSSAWWKAEPFRFKSPPQYAALRDLFRRAGYTHEAMCARLGIGSVYEFKETREGRSEAVGVMDGLSLFVRLFLEADEVPWDDVRRVLTSEDIELLEAFGLIERGAAPDSCAGTVLLYPIEQLWIVSDRTANPSDPETQPKPPADVVYPALTRNTQRFVGLMPRTSCDRFLELCGGTGIAALIAAKGFAKHAWAVDITERATRFAKFNAALNDIKNATALEGDLFAPVSGEKFDIIVAHPPYMPALEDEYIFRDGGPDGERITWRIFNGIAEHLRPGGVYYCDCLTSDRTGATVEERIRAALGEHSGEFDIMIAEIRNFDPVLYYANLAREGEMGESFESIGRRCEVFKALEIERLVFAAIMLRRRADERPGVSVRRRLSSHTHTHDFFRLLDWKSRTQAWTDADRRSLLDARLRSNPELVFRSSHRLREGQWIAEAFEMIAPAPFVVEGSVPPWFPQLLVWMDGDMRAREHLQHLKDAGHVPDNASEDEFATMLFNAVDGGYATIVTDDAVVR